MRQRSDGTWSAVRAIREVLEDCRLDEGSAPDVLTRIAGGVTTHRAP